MGLDCRSQRWAVIVDFEFDSGTLIALNSCVQLKQTLQFKNATLLFTELLIELAEPRNKAN